MNTHTHTQIAASEISASYVIVEYLNHVRVLRDPSKHMHKGVIIMYY